MKAEKATVRWFDNFSGEGVVRLENGENIFIHHTALYKNFPLKKDFYCRILFPKQNIYVKVFRDSHFTQIEEVL